MIIFAHSLLLLLFHGLLPTSVRLTVVSAAPIPVHDLHASAHSHATPPHSTLAFGAHHTPQGPGGERFTGAMRVHPDAQHAMTEQRLHEHAHHIATQLSQQHGAPHVVHATHTPRHVSLRFAAVRDPNGQHVQHPGGHTETLHVPRNQRPQIHTPTMNTAQQDALHAELLRDRQHHTAHDVAPQPGVHGEGKHGTLHVDPAHRNAGLTPDQLKVHAHFVAQNLFPHPQNHDVRVEVKHRPGDPHATYHAVTADGGVITHYPPPTAAEKAAIKQHVASTFATNGDHDHGSFHAPNQRWTFSGGLPTHPGSPHHMSHEHMKEYSFAIKDALIVRHASTGTPQQKGHAKAEIDSMALTSIHQPGSQWVSFGSQPRGEAFQTAINNLHPDLTAAHTLVGHTVQHGGADRPWPHAESKVLDTYPKDPGIAAGPGTAHHHLQGVTIGVAGQGDKPCQNCHNVLGQFPVHYADMNRPLPPGVDRAIQ